MRGNRTWISEHEEMALRFAAGPASLHGTKLMLQQWAQGMKLTWQHGRRKRASMPTQPGHLVSANGSGMAESIIAKLSCSVGLVTKYLLRRLSPTAAPTKHENRSATITSEVADTTLLRRSVLALLAAPGTPLSKNLGLQLAKGCTTAV